MHPKMGKQLRCAPARSSGGDIMLNIQHFTKTYGEKRAVDDLSLHIAPGEIYGFIGHNGAGKTTTLKAAVGILQFDAGEITIGGHSIQTEPLACKRLLAYIPDNPDLYDFMSGIQYLNFIADVFGIPAAERWARIEPYADAFELTGDLAQPESALWRLTAYRIPAMLERFCARRTRQGLTAQSSGPAVRIYMARRRFGRRWAVCSACL